ncbi:ABC transporter permease [uncultured Xylophilus sp.]|uniref:ABC transporter permease n=1 Tax=uncultured Xylophilus sp. TaxID=296832 RepID=UPI0025ED35BC|nr:ABC transporter permease [uncultured Xylophilus sp.]
MFALLRTFSWQEVRHQPWRYAAAVVAVMLGVALAFSVHLINASALDEFANAVRTVDGRPDLSLRAVQETFDDRAFDTVAGQPGVQAANPVLETSATARGPGGEVALRVVGLDTLAVVRTAPDLAPRTLPGADRLAIFLPDSVFLNPAALSALALAGTERADASVTLQGAAGPRTLRLAGTVAAGGGPLAVMDVAAVQAAFGREGRLSRIDLRLATGTDRSAVAAAAPGLVASVPGDAENRIGNLSRAYRVNLTVLALIALFTGAFLVFSVLALGVAKRAPQFALLGVLGLPPRQRRALVLAESLVLGAVGSAVGLAAGAGLAALALRLLGGDLGGGYFSGVAPSLRLDATPAVAYGLLGVAAALAGGWWPARAAERLPPAQTLKGLGTQGGGRPPVAGPLALLAGGTALAFAPPLGGVPVAAYLSVALLLVGGITGLPWLVALLLDQLQPLAAQRALPLLALERARRMRGSAAVAVSGVVAALALAVALTVMVASFRGSVMQWLDTVLPADLYLRAGMASGGADGPSFGPGLPDAVRRLPGVERVEAQRLQRLQLDPARPAVALIARPLQAARGGVADVLPLRGSPLPVPPGKIGIYVSEAMVDLYGARPGTDFAPLSQAFPASAQAQQAPSAIFFVAGVWRDYVRQFGAVVVDSTDYERLTGDRRSNDLALWLAPGAEPAAVQQAVRDLLARTGDGPAADAVEFSSSAALRATSLRIFDRSFAVTYWLQAVAIGIGLFGVAASFGAQVLARRKEFGLLAHLGLTRRQVLAVVAGEGAAWTAVGAVAGVGLGLAVAVVLVHVVNPQSFHWTMDLQVPGVRLLALALAVVAAGTLTARIAGSAAAGRDAVLAVKEDW